MARIRSIHPGLFTDEDFVALSMAARVFLIGLWTEADDQGIFVCKPVTLKMRLFPADSVRIDDVLAEVTEAGVVTRFEADGKDYGALKNFCKWQRPKSPQYLHPCPEHIEEVVCLPKASYNPDSERGTALGRILHDAQDGKCLYCGGEITFYRKRANSLEVDHKTPISRGGTDKIDNLAAACKSCNQLKRTLTVDEFLAKFAKSELVERYESHCAKAISQSPKTFSQSLFPPEGETDDQMEDVEEEIDGGDKFSSKIRKLPKRKRYFTEDELIDPDFYGTAVELGLEPQSEWEKFRDYHVKEGKGTLSAKASFRTWCKNAVEYVRRANLRVVR